MRTEIREKITEFVRNNHKDIVEEIIKDLGSQVIINDIVKYSTNMEELTFEEFIIAIYQAIILERASFTMFDVMEVVNSTLLTSMFGDRIFAKSYWEYKNWN